MRQKHLHLATSILVLIAACSFEAKLPVFPDSSDQSGSDTTIDQTDPDQSQDTTEPDGTQPDTVENLCELNGGNCTPFTPGVDGPVCGQGSTQIDIPGCGDDEVCCMTEGGCVAEGGHFEDFEDQDQCCEGLTPVSDCTDDSGECICPNCPCFVCTKCGDGTCGLGENRCNCPEDCAEAPNECKDEGGFCAPECPEGTGAVFLGGCNNEQCCMDENTQCAGPGETVPVTPDAKQCCPGLKSIGQTDWTPGEEECMVLPGAMVCTDCGNGTCETDWEAPCSCPEDCKVVPPNECVESGGECFDNSCPNGYSEVDVPGCPGNETCCFQVPDDCIAEGDTGGNPMVQECCPGLDQVGIFEDISPSDLETECETLIGDFLCTDCGNGQCEEWENHCNCPTDCGGTQLDCYGTLEPCPDGEYCKIPEGTCDLMGQWGACTQVPSTCTSAYAPVCGCNDVQYYNECFMEFAKQSMAHAGECSVNDDCIEDCEWESRFPFPKPPSN